MDATLKELEILFPREIAADGSLAKVRKFHVVKTARSVYESLAGTGALRPTQKTPISNFFLAGVSSYHQHKFTWLSFHHYVDNNGFVIRTLFSPLTLLMAFIICCTKRISIISVHRL